MASSKREAVNRICAFCRLADDAADLDPEKGRAALARLREELEFCYAGRPRHPVMRALAPHIREYGLSREHFERILEGHALDLEKARFATIADLESYMDGVACAPGILVLEVLGLRDEEKAREYSGNLSRGLQMVSILRDLGADAARDRVYLPREDFDMFGCTEEALKAGQASEEFFRLARYEVSRARGYFRRAQMALGPVLRRRLLGPEIARETYEALLKKMEPALDLCLDGKAPGISLPERFLIAMMTWTEGRATS